MSANDIRDRAAAIFARMVEERRRDQEAEREQRDEQRRQNDLAVAEYEAGGTFVAESPDTTPDGRPYPELVADALARLEELVAEARTKLATGRPTDAQLAEWHEALEGAAGWVAWLRERRHVVNSDAWARALALYEEGLDLIDRCRSR